MSASLKGFLNRGGGSGNGSGSPLGGKASPAAENGGSPVKGGRSSAAGTSIHHLLSGSRRGSRELSMNGKDPTNPPEGNCHDEATEPATPSEAADEGTPGPSGVPDQTCDETSRVLKSVFRPLKILVCRINSLLMGLSINFVLACVFIVYVAVAIAAAYAMFLYVSAAREPLMCPEREMKDFLGSMRLSQYSSLLCNQGYELLEDLSRASENDLETIGITVRPHRLRITANAERHLKQWSWQAWFLLFAVAAAVMLAAVAAAAYFIFPPVRQRVQTAAAIGILVVWQKLMASIRVWESIDVSQKEGLRRTS